MDGARDGEDHETDARGVAQNDPVTIVIRAADPADTGRMRTKREVYERPARRVSRVGGVAIVSALLLSGCATVSEEPAAQPSDPLLRTVGLATVLDDGDGAELCLGGVAESYPPQCGGPRLIGWAWEGFEESFEEANGVRWGLFAVEGHYDADANTFDVTTISDMPLESRPVPQTDFSTPCAEPDGGWRVSDSSAVTMEDREEAFAVAATLDGYAGAWVDRVPHEMPSPTPGDDDSQIAYEEAMNDPLFTIINVQVTGDPAVAEERLREVWSGMLCVTTAERTEAELLDIVHELIDTDGSLGVGTGTNNNVELSVIYDDGTLQRELDEKYGEGVVIVSSALVAA